MTGAGYPEGHVTILFTDIEDSSAMARSVGDEPYRECLRAPQNRVLREAAAAAGGLEVGTPAGDSLMLVFAEADAAVECALTIQRTLRASPIQHRDPEGREWTVRVRLGLHTSETPLRLSDHGEYVSADVSFAKRVESLGVGGQVLVSSSAWRAATLSRSLRWKRWPNRHLRGFDRLETVYELLWSGRSLGEPGAAGRPLQERIRVLYQERRWPEARHCLQEALDMTRRHGDRRGEALTLANLGAVCIHGNRFAEAEEHLEQAALMARHLGDRGLEARVLGNLGVAAHRRGDLDEAGRAWERCLGILEDLRDGVGTCRVLGWLGRLYRDRGQAARAARCLGGSREAAVREGLREEEARAFQALALQAQGESRVGEAERLYQQALEIAVPSGLRCLEGQVLNNLGLLAGGRGHRPQAERCYRASAEILEEVGDSGGMGRAQVNLGALLLEQGNLGEARVLLEEGREHLRGAGDRQGDGAALANLALVARRQGLASVAAALARAAAARLEGAGDPARAGTVAEWLDSWDGGSP